MILGLEKRRFASLREKSKRPLPQVAVLFAGFASPSVVRQETPYADGLSAVRQARGFVDPPQ